MKNLECRADLFFINTGVYVQTTVFCFKDGGFHANTEFELKKVPTLHSRYIYIYMAGSGATQPTHQRRILFVEPHDAQATGDASQAISLPSPDAWHLLGSSRPSRASSSLASARPLDPPWGIRKFDETNETERALMPMDRAFLRILNEIQSSCMTICMSGKSLQT